MRLTRALLPALLLPALLLAAGGCSEYLDRRDGILLGVGEAVGTNVVTHTIDPWPAHARRVEPYTDGERAQRAVERYRSPQTERGGSGGASGAAPVAAIAQPPLVR